MDVDLSNWIVSSTTCDRDTASDLADNGERLLKAEPSISQVIEAECHVRLAALRLLTGDVDRAHRHGEHTVSLARDLSDEAQLHLLPRAIAVFRSAERMTPDESAHTASVVETAGDALARSMTRSIKVADELLTQASVLLSIGADQVDANAAARQREWQARLQLEFERGGEPELAERIAPS